MLRGVAALAVVAAHAANHGAGKTIPDPWFRSFYAVVTQGYLGVPLFFVISGFCIHLRWSKRKAAGDEERLEFLPFWKRRLHRLYLTYFVVLCGSMAAVLIAWARGLQIDTVTRYPEPRGTWIGADFLSHALMLHGLHPLFDRSGGNQPFWTLAREEYFYLAYFLVLGWRRARGMLPALALVVLVSAAGPALAGAALQAAVPDPGWQGLLDYPVNSHNSALALWSQWCLGMLAAEAYCGLVKLPGWCRAGTFVPVWGLAAGGADWLRLEWLSAPLWGLTFFTLVNWAVSAEERGRLKSNRAAEWLAGVGVFSYSLYLVHSPLLGLLNQAEVRLAERFGIPLSSPFEHLLVWAGGVALACGAARLLYLAVERRFQHARPTPAGPATSV